MSLQQQLGQETDPVILRLNIVSLLFIIYGNQSSRALRKLIYGISCCLLSVRVAAKASKVLPPPPLELSGHIFGGNFFSNFKKSVFS